MMKGDKKTGVRDEAEARFYIYLHSRHHIELPCDLGGK
jgi:hypothetical protein